MNAQYDLDTPLLQFLNEKGGSVWSIRDAFEGTQIFGGIGSGKTSGSGRLIAHKFLTAGFGGLVLTVKADEAQLWKDYCLETNRLDDLIIIEPGGKNVFNFMEYESTARERTYTQNLVSILSTVIKAGKEQESKGSSDDFWQDALTLTMTNAIDLCILAYGKANIETIYEIFLTAPRKDGEKSEEEGNPDSAFTVAFNKALERVQQKIDEWEKSLSQDKIDTLKKEGLLDVSRDEAVPISRQLTSVYTFFIERYRTLSDKTRSIVDFSFMAFLTRLLQEPVYSLFCNKPSNVVPEDCLKGKIILLNIPVKHFDQVGRDCQILFKFIWQRAMERRNIDIDGRPLFLWADESQFLLHPMDSLFQTTARSSRIATVYLTQNVSNYHANMGGGKSEHYVQSFLGTLATKIFHANADLPTNQYASSLIGEAYLEQVTRAVSTVGQVNVTNTVAYELEKVVRPEAFVSLRTGGPRNSLLVEAFIHRQGNTFPTGLNHEKITFVQKRSS